MIRDEEGLHVLPGGLARVSPQANDLHSGTRLGGGTKDCWILGGDDEAVPKMPRMPAASAELVRGGVARTSRRLDDLFWMARGAERIEHLARCLRCAVDIEERYLAEEIDARVSPVDQILSDYGIHLPADAEGRSAALAAALGGPMLQEAQSLHRLALNCRNLMSQGSLSTAHELEFLCTPLKPGPDGQIPLEQLKSRLERLIHTCLALAGSAYENTVRDWAWTFIEMGRRLERGVQLVRWAQAFVAADDDERLWHLSLADSLLTYRARYLDRIDAASVQDTLLSDESNPRALQFQVDHLLRAIEALPDPSADGGYRIQELRRNLERAMGQLSLESITAESLQHMHDTLLSAAESIDHIWFSHSAAPRAINRSPDFEGGDLL